VRRIATAALVLAAFGAARAQDLDRKKAWPVVLKSAHYQIHSDATKEQAQKLLDHMELLHATYTRLFALSKAPTARLTIVLFKDRKGYEAHGETPKGSVAYYDQRHLVGYYDEERMYNYFAHEGTHQFTDVALKDLSRAPMWFTEGIAECLGNSEVRDGKLFVATRNGRIARENLPVIQKMIREKTYVPLRDLVTLSDGEFKGREGMYPQSWSLCHFLLAAPGYEDSKCEIPNGKYRPVLSTFITLMSKRSTKLEKALAASFTLKGKPLDLDALEKEWAAYVLGMTNEAVRD
jgi:hypothetical protein